MCGGNLGRASWVIVQAFRQYYNISDALFFIFFQRKSGNAEDFDPPMQFHHEQDPGELHIRAADTQVGYSEWPRNTNFARIC